MKNAVVFCIMVALALSANASYLCWQVSSTDKGMGDVQSWAASNEMNWDTATITISDGAKNVTASLYNFNFAEPDYSADTAPVQIDLNGLNFEASGFSYFIEMVNSESGTKLGKQTGTYADLASAVYQNAIPIDDIEQMQTKAWHGSSAGYKATPEPTSAMLMLLGVAGLALRRKQRKIA